jgi:SAM-dependent methyltransferase
MPHSDGLLTAADLARPEPRYPLTVLVCPACSLVQLRETVSPEVLFDDAYQYYSSYSDAWLAHCRDNALELIETRRLGAESLVVELASNDGYMLRNFIERRVPVLGIDPAPGPARAAREAGVPTREAFFGRDLARAMRGEGLAADVVLANNVLAHVPDLTGFVDGIGTLLREDGVAVIEVPYVRDLIERCEFDTIYHQHLCYFSVGALVRLFADRGLTLADVRRLPTHGGSLRLYVTRQPGRSRMVDRLLEEERALGVDGIEYYLDFAARVRHLRTELLELLTDLKRRGQRIAAYGAAAKGTILVNAVGIGRELVDYVVDRNPHKHGRYVPGVRLPIHGPERLLEDRPDYALILPWNLRDEIVGQQAEFRRRGGRFIVPIPRPEILS